jgi:hypothetical protein
METCAPSCAAGYRVHSSDIASYEDFPRSAAPNGCNAVITNAPFGWARQFIEHALRIIEPHLVSSPMLLRVDYDSARTRQHLFAHCPAFAVKVTLI